MGGAEPWDVQIHRNSQQLLRDGRQIFRFDTFGDEAFWGGQLRLHEALATLSPNQLLYLGVKVDAAAIKGLRLTPASLKSPATTLALLRRKAVVGVTGFFNEQGNLTSVGFQCAVCHSIVNNSVAFGVGKRLDGWPNRDLDVGQIIASAPDLSIFATLLGLSQDQVRTVLRTWGPGKFDAELLLDGKAFNPEAPDTVPNKSAATLNPAAFGLAGFNNHTWTGGWGTVTYWNAFVANLELRGQGTFFDPRLDDPVKYPIAAAHPELFGHKRDPEDKITAKLPALHFYQLAIPAPKPKPGLDFDPEAAERGDQLFEADGKARCASCHVEPLWTEPGWNTHKPQDIRIEAFQANRSPDNSYKTMNLAGIFTRERGYFMRPENKGRLYHDGRFKTLMDVVNSYDVRFGLGLTAGEKSDLVEYLKSL